MDRSGNGDSENCLLKALRDPITNFEKSMVSEAVWRRTSSKPFWRRVFKPNYGMYGMEGFSLQKDLNFFILKGSALEGAGKMQMEGGGTRGVHQQTGFFGRRVNPFCGGATRVQGCLLPLCIREEQVRDPRLVALFLNV